MTSNVRDPVHQFIDISPLELKIIDSTPVQRLRRIHQLSLSFLVWPGARHSRFEHAIGTMHLAGRAFESALRNADKKILASVGWDDRGKADRAKANVRLGALLHDVGHSPFSHGPEELFADGSSHEFMSAKIIEESVIAEILRESLDDSAPKLVADIAVGPKVRSIENQETLLLSEIVTGSVGVDRWDYLLRDSLYTGAQYGMYDVHRLLESLTLTEVNDAWSWALGPGGQYVGEQFLLSRWFMFLNVYTHKTRRILDKHLLDFLCTWLPEKSFPDKIPDYLRLDDWLVLTKLDEKKNQSHRDLILRRNHHRLIGEFRREDFAEEGKMFDPQTFVDFLRDVHSDIQDDSFEVNVSQPEEHELYVVSETGEVSSFADQLGVIGALKSHWVGRAYAPRDQRDELRAQLDADKEKLLNGRKNHV